MKIHPYFYKVNLPESFSELFEPALLEQMEKKGKEVVLSEGDVLLDYGQIVRNMPIILSGSLKVLRKDDKGHELLLYYVSKNEGCAMTFSCCMEQFPSEIKVVAEEDSELFLLPIDVMDRWLHDYPTWKNFVMQTMRNRFNELLRTIDQMAFQKLDERLISYLKDKSEVSSSALINLSHEQIANELATSREVVSRLLKKLENDGKVLLYRNQIKLLSSF